MNTQELRRHINELTDLRVELYSQGNKESAVLIQKSIDEQKMNYKKII
tara:strand:+ start:350 stop:493 length:144 start_codon:yes stop_codon:yes gene_type:complete